MTRLLLLIFVAGGLGTLVRFSVIRWVAAQSSGVFPWGTLIVNCAGSFFCGLVFAVLQARQVSPEWRAVVLLGFLGALTTFSTFALESVLMMRGERVMPAVVNLLLTNVGGVLCLTAGLLLGRVFPP